MTTRMNPYDKQPGFGFRYLRAKTALERFGRDPLASPYCRSFDNCFEMNDGDAVVWALMHRAIKNAATGDHYLAEGIRRLGASVWPQWLRVFEAHGSQSRQPELAV